MQIEWNKVTTYSKILAAVLFIALPFGGFFLGSRYEQLATTVQEKEQTGVLAQDVLLKKAVLDGASVEELEAVVDERLFRVLRNSFGEECPYISPEANVLLVSINSVSLSGDGTGNDGRNGGGSMSVKSEGREKTIFFTPDARICMLQYGDGNIGPVRRVPLREFSQFMNRGGAGRPYKLIVDDDGLDTWLISAVEQYVN
ncbi:MAG: hypothetical protein AAB495_04500 [Patescibacteria group bacterium]